MQRDYIFTKLLINIFNVLLTFKEMSSPYSSTCRLGETVLKSSALFIDILKSLTFFFSISK